MTRVVSPDRPSQGEDEAGPEFQNLSDVLDRVDAEAESDGHLSIEELLPVLGARSFGVLMLLPALFVISPLSAFVGFDSVMGVLIAAVAAQALFGKRHVWLPRFALRARVSRERVGKAVRAARPVARVLDRLSHPRLKRLAHAPFSRAVAFVCLAIGATMPPLEVVPFSNTGGAAVVVLFSLGLVVRDGVLVLLGFAACVALGGAFALAVV